MISAIPLLASLSAVSPVHAQSMRPAIPLAMGTTAHSTFDKGEQKDYSIQINPGTYYFLVDTRRSDGEISNIQGKIQLLKTNGVIVDPNLMFINEIGVVARNVVRYVATKPLAARLRVSFDQGPMLVWLSVIPAVKWSFVAFPSGKGELKPLGIGAVNGKGGTLDAKEWAYHTIKLPAGKWTVMLYGKRTDGTSSNVQADLELLDEYGAKADPSWKLNLNEIGVEARRDKPLVLGKPKTLIFKVMTQNAPLEYTIDIEKGAD